MRYALINNVKTEASPGLKGVCPGCGLPVIAKCGDLRIHHWAHVIEMKCDHWWESETLWHRAWKDNFQQGWQEVPHRDPGTNEVHIADIRTEHGLVVEFQRSSIKPDERQARENFYKSMVWVVDGTRVQNNYSRFLKGQFVQVQPNHYWVNNPDECLPAFWLNSNVPVIFDFQGTETIADENDRRNFLYCLFPGKIGNSVYMIITTRSIFIQGVISGQWWNSMVTSMNVLNDHKKQLEAQQGSIKRMKEQVAFQNFSRAMRGRRRGRF